MMSYDIRQQWPQCNPASYTLQASFSLPVLDLRVADNQYQTALAVLTGNVSEDLVLPHDLALLHASGAQING